MTLEEQKEQYNKNLVSYLEGMVPYYEDATIAQKDVNERNLVYQLLSMIAERISV